MKTVDYDTETLQEAEYNPRQLTEEQFANLKTSIEEFGFVDPIIVNTHEGRKNVVVGGHQRLKVAKLLNYNKVPCVEVKLPVARERELNIRLNKNVGEWDWDALANNFDVSDLIEWGFSDGSFTGFKDIDYTVLDQVDDGELDVFLDGTRKAIQIEFRLEDYEEATSLINNGRKNGLYIGGMLIESLKNKAV